MRRQPEPCHLKKRLRLYLVGSSREAPDLEREIWGVWVVNTGRQGRSPRDPASLGPWGFRSRARAFVWSPNAVLMMGAATHHARKRAFMEHS